MRLEPLEDRVVLSGAPLVISELMASNNTTLADEDGDFSDWIEIYNPGTSDTNLGGFHLTDDATNLAKWSMPEETLAAGDVLLVFASEKDRRVAGEQLHTNFKLASAGEYLALTQDDPQNAGDIRVVSEFAPGYPPQHADISYGITQSATIRSLLDDGGVLQGNVSGPVPDQWRAFAVGGGEATIDIVPLAEDEVFAGSPVVNAVQWQVDTFALEGQGDQGFDEDPSWVPIVPGEEYHAEFYVKSANADGSDQTFNLGFPIFDQDRDYLGREPGGMSDLTASSEWTKIVAPVFSDEEARFGHVSWRVQDDGGQNAILIAMPSIGNLFLGDVNGDGDVNGLDVDPFVDVLVNGPYQSAADMNEDGEVNGLDVDLFVTAIVGDGGAHAVPEPSTWLILLIGGLLLGCATRRQKTASRISAPTSKPASCAMP